MMEGQRQLIELAPPMDPPAGRGGGGLLAANGSTAVGGSSSRSRPVNLPGLSAGLAAISANYGGLFDQSLQQHQQQQQHRQQQLEEDADRFRASSVVQHTQEQHHNHQQQHQQHHQLLQQQPSSSSLAPLMAAALCRPASQHFQSAPLIYSPYGDSQPSDPESTPTTATTLGCLSNTSSGTSQSQQQSPYAGAFSPAISLDPLGMVPWFWNWQLGDLQQLAYCPPPEHHHLLLHQNAHHLFSPPADLYLHPPAAGEQLLISHSGGNSNNGLVPSSGASGNLFGDQFAGESPTTWRIPQKEKGNISGNSQATAGSCAVKRSQTTAVAAAGQMPRGQPRKGGRRPREQEDPNLTKDEKDRREKRRERNKQAAARCRRRREERMQTLEEQVAELQALNAEKEAMLQQLFQQRDMLMAELAKRGMPMKLEQLESMAAATSSSSSRGGKRAQTNSRKAVPSQQQPSAGGPGRKRNLVQHVQPFKMEPTTAAEQQDSTPGSPPNGGNNFADNSRCMLVNGNDPVISSESTMVPQQQPAPMLFEQSGRENGGGGGQQQQHVQQQQQLEEPPPPSTTASSRPNYLQLSRLYKEGYMASTPSKDLATFGSGGGGHGGLLGTPGSEMITPGYNQIGNNESYGVLMAQQTGLTPCQHGPVPVLVQQQDGSERPPNNGELSELR